MNISEKLRELMAFLDDCAREHDPVADLQDRVRDLERRLDAIAPDLTGSSPDIHAAGEESINVQPADR